MKNVKEKHTPIALQNKEANHQTVRKITIQVDVTKQFKFTRCFYGGLY